MLIEFVIKEPGKRSAGQDNGRMESPPVSLLHRIRETGARQDWEQLSQLCMPRLYHRVRRGKNGRVDAGDMVHHVLVTLMEHLTTGNYDEKFSVRAW